MNYAMRKGFGQFKITTGDGMPDRCVYKGSLCFFIEFKTPTGKLLNSQKIMIRTMCKKYRADVHIIRSAAEGKLLIDYKIKQFVAHNLL